MILTRTKVIILFAVAFILQPFIGALFGLSNFGPNLLLCLSSILLVLYHDSPLIWGMSIGLGLVYDICYSATLGVATIGILVCMLGVLVVRYFFYLDNILLVPILTAIDSLGFNLVKWLISHSQGSIYTFGYMLKYSLLDFIGNGIALLIMYFILNKYLVKHKNDQKMY
ncbi:MAG: rod shape-determining protein MreD [Clostridia bacterium]|nr:rod shape-determining protein MreD [Clostridia bacterium]